MNIRKSLSNIELISSFYDKLREFLLKNVYSDERIINKRFKKRLGRSVNLDSPEKFNDKIQWLKLNWYDPLGTICADKYNVRNYVKEKIGKEYLNRLIEVYDSVKEIDINKLPKSFVLKATHGSGYNIVCKNKELMNWNQEFRKMRRWMRTNYHWRNREWVYKDIKPRIICEQYLSDIDGNPPMDYKFFCFDGKPKMIQVDFNRFSNLKRNFYDIEWNFLDVEIEYSSDKSIGLEKPENLEEMLDLSKKLSEGFPHVRVDFYNVDGKIIFGELTFFNEAGFGKFYPPEFEIELGKCLNLPKNN